MGGFCRIAYRQTVFERVIFIYMNQKRITDALNREPILKQLDIVKKLEPQMDELQFKMQKARHHIDSAFSDALSEICTNGHYGLLERAAFSAVFAMEQPAQKIDELVERVDAAFNRLLTVHQSLRRAHTPLLAYAVIRQPKKDDFRPNQLIEYSYRSGDGSGLVIEERALPKEGGEKYFHDIHIPEVSIDNKHARKFGHTSYIDEPIVFSRSPKTLLTWADGPQAAADDLAAPPKNSLTTHVLIGSHEINDFFDICQPSEHYDTLYGHAALMGFHFSRS